MKKPRTQQMRIKLVVTREVADRCGIILNDPARTDDLIRLIITAVRYLTASHLEKTKLSHQRIKLRPCRTDRVEIRRLRLPIDATNALENGQLLAQQFYPKISILSLINLALSVYPIPKSAPVPAIETTPSPTSHSSTSIIPSRGNSFLNR